MKRIYLSGPMTGLPELNFPAFHREATRLRALGFEVENPAELNAGPSATWADCMRADIARLVLCDSLALLQGHEASRGARLERHIAHELGMPVTLAAYITHRPAQWERAAA